MDATQWSVVETERLALADLLAGLTPAQWRTPSLCSEWSVRDVAAHVAMTPTEPRLGTLVVGLARTRGDLWAFGRDIARAYARRPTAEIVAEVRRQAASRRLPVITNGENTLLDIMVHSQDIARPLGLEHPMPLVPATAALHRVWSMGWPFRARRRLRGLRLVATDVECAVGDGARVEGAVADLLLLATGRTEAALPRLRGPGVELAGSRRR